MRFLTNICLFQVIPDVRHESLSCKTFPYLLIKMINKSRWKILGVLAVFLLMVWYTISREESYTREPPLFLQLKDYFWEKTPSLYELPYGTKGAEEILLRLLTITSFSLPENIESLKCRRCAVVGNGYRLRNSSMGEVINKYDIVIRLNNAPVHGYERDVGTKTTMRLFYPESAHFNPQTDNNPNTLLVLVAFKPMDFLWLETILHDKKRKPTTGLVAITVALHFCDVVDIAGFGYPSSDDKKQSIHYYEHVTVKSMASSGHNVSHEALAIKQMLELGLVKNLTYF
ncbi:hypothetical protein Chor_002405 [Crotalus horridus]